MKLIVENEKEKNQLEEVFYYLQDFHITRKIRYKDTKKFLPWSYDKLDYQKFQVLSALCKVKIEVKNEITPR